MTLVRLQFQDEFNQKLYVGTLPFFLKQLVLGEQYNMPLERGVLPANLKELYLGDRFNHPLAEPGILPAQLTHLHIGSKFSRLTNFTAAALPPTLRYLDFPAGTIDGLPLVQQWLASLTHGFAW